MPFTYTRVIGIVAPSVPFGGGEVHTWWIASPLSLVALRGNFAKQGGPTLILSRFPYLRKVHPVDPIVVQNSVFGVLDIRPTNNGSQEMGQVETSKLARVHRHEFLERAFQIVFERQAVSSIYVLYP